MASPSALNTLIDLAHKETDEAAKQLGLALRIGDEAVQKLDLLLQYRNDYAERCQSNLTSGISTTHFNNFQMFMQKLDHAISGQQKVVNDTQRTRNSHAASCGATRSRTTSMPPGARNTKEPLPEAGPTP